MTATTLVTGATGFVGSHVVRHLVARGESVRALARPSSRRDLLSGLPVEFADGDLRDPASLERACRGVRRVYHVAADYRLWAADPREIYESNVTGTRNLLDAARQAGVERFVYTSTVATIAVPRHGALPDESTAATVDEMIGHYKRSKFLAEQEALAAAERGLPVVIVNPTTPVGPGDVKPTPTGRILLDFLRGRMPAYVDTGLNLVAVEDVASGHLLAAERGAPGRRYILGNRNLTLKEILDVLARITGRSAPRVRLPHAVAYMAGLADELLARVTGREPQIPLEGVRMSRHKMFVDCSRAVRELGFAPEPVEAALERAVRWFWDRGYAAPGPVLAGMAA
ncbi:MAG: NAD-dependent epimerase/dehydratase family protein [Acidobacteriota bacterium]|nr:NAD-dependent epimerase/dehydratase family protein [Acidobacteriota bacterium]